MFNLNHLAIFVPASPSASIATIVAKGSAIVGQAGSDEAEPVTVDYEGAVYAQVNLQTYADRARQAAGRQLQHYPTVARTVVRRDQLRQVGWFDPQSGIILLEDSMEAVAAWLGVEAVDPEDLQFSDSSHRSSQP